MRPAPVLVTNSSKVVATRGPAAWTMPTQETFDALEPGLFDTTFVVVDLETTGGSPTTCAITEIGAVKVHRGEVVGEFQTLVRPPVTDGRLVPPFIAVLTGITDAMVADAPPISAVLPSFLEFAHGAVLVAHNAPFDVGFLRAACAATALPWPSPPVVDTARLARNVLSRDEAHSCRLSVLASVLGSPVTPNHRALADARATAHVLHAMIARLGNRGVTTLGELQAWQLQVSDAQRRQRGLVADVPHAPGVYVFRDERGEPLYVGRSRDMRTRVRTYFTASEKRRRMAEMVGLAAAVTPMVCATELEAQVREVRLIGEAKPRYNRRSRHPERGVWLKLTDELYPRLSLVARPLDDAATYVGPFSSRRLAENAQAALNDAVPLRQCSQRLSRRSRLTACVLAGLGRCSAPCTGEADEAEYAAHAVVAAQALTADATPVVERILARIAALSAQQRFEEAGRQRDRLVALLRAADRAQRVAALSTVEQLIAARRFDQGGWEVHILRQGRLAGAGIVRQGIHPQATIDALVGDAEHVRQPTRSTPACTAEESELILRWLDLPGVRLVEVEGTWALPVRAAGRWRDLLVSGSGDRAAADPFADGRRLRPEGPAR